MKTALRVLLLWELLMLFICPRTVSSNNTINGIQFEHLTFEQGLSRPTVYAIIQDKQGFIWFGTEDGLNRDDGYTFKVYRPDPNNPNSLSSGAIGYLYQDHEGNIWIGTRNQGLNKFDPVTETFTRYVHDDSDPGSLSYNYLMIAPICEDTAGVLWVGTRGGGLNKFDRVTQKFAHYRHNDKDPHSLSHDSIRAICPGVRPNRTHILWIGTEGGGLDKFDPSSQTFIHYRHDDSDPNSLSNDVVIALYADISKGMVWVGTRGGLDKFDPATDRFTHYRHDDNNPKSLSHNDVYTIYPDQDGTLWISTLGGGLNHFDPVKETFIQYRNDPNNPNSLSNDNAHPICRDSAGALWVGTWGGGVNRFDPHRKKFGLHQHHPNVLKGLSHPSVFSIYEDSHAAIWIGTGRGLNKFDPATETYTHYWHAPNNPHSLSHNMVYQIYEDRYGILWVATFGGGLNKFDRTSETFTCYLNDNKNPFSLSEDSVRTICEDGQGNLWVGTTYGGLNKLDREHNSFTRYQYDPNNPDSLCSNNIWKLFRDRTGTLWIGTGNGLCRFEPTTEKFIRYQHDDKIPHSLSENTVMSIYEDKKGMLWIGTDIGLNKFDGKTGCFTHYFEKHGLSSDRVDSIVEDDRGNLWLGTNKGLSKFNPDSETCLNYDVQDGLQSNMFYYQAVTKSQDGKLYFGGTNGFNAFYPDDIKDNPYIPQAVLTDFKIFNESARIGDGYPLQRSITRTEKIVLSLYQSVFSFEFAMLNYSTPKKNRYAYMLEGFDHDWTFTDSGSRIARYTNLDPGEYVFRVKGSNNDRRWNEKGTSVKLVILSPWWKTKWFIISMLGLLAVLMFGGHRWRVHSINQRNRLLESLVTKHTKELRESEERYRMIFNHSPLGIMHFDHNGVIRDFNEKFVEIIGAPRDRILGFNMVERLQDQGMLQAVKNTLNGKSGYYEGDYRSITGGKITPIRTIFQRIVSQDGSFIGAVGLFEDITEREQAEELVRKSEQRYRDVVENANDAIIVVQDGMIKFFNRRALEISGYAEKEYLSKPFVDYIHPEDRELVVKRYFKHMEGFDVSAPYEFRIIDAYGRIRCMEINAVSIEWEERPATLNFLTDISQIKEIEIERHNNIKLQGVLEMAGAVCHEMNQPMQVVLGYSELLLEEIPQDNPWNEELTIIRQEIKRMAEITRKLERNTKYEQIDYVGDMKIIDLNRSSRPE
ncbi:MAG: PAS domain S-box protein [Deltaproteobacteria bacterium]|nr:PAS domain S-box protein [Deltaproteobacteria bacterium]